MSEQSNSIGVINLSEQDIQMLQCLLNGNTNKFIAKKLSITEASVQLHLKGLLQKIHVDNRIQAAKWALQHGLSSDISPSGL